MKVLVVLGHQRSGSFCHAIAQAVVEQLRADGHETIFHDLYAEGFDPILREEELLKEPRLDPVVRRHADELMSCDGYVVIHPNWWGQPPAILKGWVDRVIRQGEAYRFGPQGLIPGLVGRRAVVFTTSNTPRDQELSLYGDPLENLWKTCIFGFCGVEDFVRRNFESVILSTAEQRAGWLNDARQLVRQRFGSA